MATDQTINIRVRPDVKQKALEDCKAERTSLTKHIEYLIMRYNNLTTEKGLAEALREFPTVVKEGDSL